MSDAHHDSKEILSKLYGKGKPLDFVITSVIIASSADSVQNLVTWGIGRKRPPKPLPPLPHVDIWLRMYRSHRSFFNDIGEAFELPSEFTATDIQAGVREVSRIPQDEIEQKIAKLTKDELKACIVPFQGVPFPPDDHTLRKMLNDLDADAKPEIEGEPDALDDLLASTSGQFFVRVWMPCLFMHRTYPQTLLRQARLGDHDALDKLLRLDKSIVYDPGIARHWHEIMHNRTRSDRNRFTKAMADGPKAKLTKKALRQGLAGLISQIAKQSQCRVTAPEINKLFDSISRVRSGHIDTNLNNSPDAFYQGVRRNSDWPSIPPKIN